MSETSRTSALVTGASAGIGAVFARRLAERGHDLILVARREERLERLSAEIRQATAAKVRIIAADLADPTGLLEVEAAVQAEARLGMLVNNAGFTVPGPLADADPGEIDRMLMVNVTALARLTRAALPGMLAKGSGSIINVSSGLTFMQLPGTAAYSGSKAFVLHFTRTLHEEVARHGIRLQALCPGLVSSEFHEAAGLDVHRYPPEMVMTPEDLVDASLAGLDQGEVVCIPSLPNLNDWESLEQARDAVAALVSSNQPAERYRQG
ncbi:MAG TPA: SDR family oxidoreductase [Geminicoccus sp.]|jgi:hypothetical protein|uniref:SDR family NAD(P)-dependent oxidoreductase n=1 Tax=Geminicoccus sp. TaxID=2024832 RepID=UPI002E2F221F|nr:SDR family oxidoreductase [Geminicoccus sp.]HEX2526206.1 SDR family oxidoreductase [Geminicoccus sp.]